MSNERPTQWMEEGEVQKLLAAPDRRTLQGKRDHAVLRVLAEGGLRESELCALRVADLTPFQGRMCLHFETLKRRSGKSLRRQVPLSDATVGAIRAYWMHEYGTASPPQEAPVFRTLGERGPYEKGPLKPWTVDGIVKRAVRAAGVAKRITPHSLRHTCATAMLRAGADLATVRDHLGHAHIATTARYLHSAFERKAAVVDALAEAWSKESANFKPSSGPAGGDSRG